MNTDSLAGICTVYVYFFIISLNTVRPRQNGCHFHIYFLVWESWFFFINKISLKLLHEDLIDSCSGDELESVCVIGPQIAKFMRPTWGPPGFCRAQMGPMNFVIRVWMSWPIIQLLLNVFGMCRQRYPNLVCWEKTLSPHDMENGMVFSWCGRLQ